MTTTTAKPPRKSVSQRKPAAPLPPRAISEVLLIDLDRIEVGPQARTEFDEITIQELAGDIEANGLLQPVLVSPVGDERYRLVCGERRLRAVRRLGQKHIPALVSKIADGAALVVQLAENIQRETMSTADLANAVKTLMDELGSVAAVANRIGKSKSWVSKHYAAATKYGWRTKELFENGAVEDLEMLGVLAQIEDAGSYSMMSHALDLLDAGEMNRQQARDYLAEIKAGRDPSRTPEDIEQAAKAEQEREARKAQKKAEREARQQAAEQSPHGLCSRIASACFKEGATVARVLTGYSAEQIGRIEAEFAAAHEAGLQARASGNAVVALAQALEEDYTSTFLDNIAVLRGFLNCALDIRGIIADGIEALKDDEA
jgi:ParB/RepB/Spo0J family partition protein